MATYLNPDSHEVLRGEIIFQSAEWTHLMIDGTDAVAVVPNEDIYPM